MFFAIVKQNTFGSSPWETGALKKKHFNMMNYFFLDNINVILLHFTIKAKDLRFIPICDWGVEERAQILLNLSIYLHGNK